MSGTPSLTEDQLKQRVVELARVTGWRVAHFRPARTDRGWRTPIEGDRGFPDLVLARRGRVLIRELKNDTGRLGEGQPQWLDALGDTGALWRPRDWPLIIAELTGDAGV